MTKKLAEYYKKRNFFKTSEPEANNITNNQNQPIFVVQHHLARKDHYDLRLEWDGALLSWAIPKGPSYDPKDKRLAIKVEDHPLNYADFEGTIPKGEYGGGTVMLWDKGFWACKSNVGECIKKGVVKFTLSGKRLVGSWSLIRLQSKDDKQNIDDNWILVKEKDEYANKTSISNFNTSIKSAKTMSQIQNKKVPNLTAAIYNKINRFLTKPPIDNEIQVGKIRITNPNKVLFDLSNVKKIDLARYYAAAAKRMLPYLKNRITSVVRCPDGVEGECFFKKHLSTISEGISEINILNGDGELEDYFYIENIYGLIFEVQMNTVEFHTWGSRIENLEQPDIIVFDLDPDEGMDIKKVRQGVRDLKKILDNLSLTSFLKTSGGKGYHVVVPFVPSVGWDKFYQFAKNISLLMEQKWPDRYTSNVRKINRKNKIFVDWERNGRGATTVAPYSVRTRTGAKVSMPISWKELSKVTPSGIDIKNALRRLSKPNPWQNFFHTTQKLN